jgi:hypothetical protein
VRTAVMPMTRHAISVLLAAPPVLRSEIARYAYSRSGIPRAFVNGAGERVYFAPQLSRGFVVCQRSFESVKSVRLEEIPSSERTDGTDHISSSDTTASPRRSSRLVRFATTFSLSVVCLLAGFAMAAAPAAETINGFVNPPTDEETLTLFVPTSPAQIGINEHITKHPLAEKLRAQPGMTESRPHLKIPPAMRPHNLTGGTLLGDGKIEVPPLTFQEKDTALPKMVQISYIGQALCGHPGIVHGGLLATLLDEGLARACFPALPNKVGVTASLKIDYRVPCPANSYLVLKAETTKVEGRKAWVKGWIELLGEEDGDGTKIVEAEALFIEPKGAASMARVYSSQ